ncbi:MAG: thioredoxin family protein [Eggerthellaceae bacterium]|nr:thioredoxin family protein [Eggerthellaceae bacterium]
MIKKLKPAAFNEIVEEQGKTCLVLVTRKDCSVCKKVHPKLEGLSEDYPDFAFYEVDVNEQPGVLTKNHLKGVPQTIFYANGNVKAVITGDAPEDDFADKIEEMQ